MQSNSSNSKLEDDIFSGIQLDKPNLNRIHIGEEWVLVPRGYIIAEKDWCGPFGDDDNHAEVLERRVMFYDLYKEWIKK
jgi:hypothetical protein